MFSVFMSGFCLLSAQFAELCPDGYGYITEELSQGTVLITVQRILATKRCRFMRGGWLFSGGEEHLWWYFHGEVVACQWETANQCVARVAWCLWGVEFAPSLVHVRKSDIGAQDCGARNGKDVTVPRYCSGCCAKMAWHVTCAVVPA